MLKTICSSLFFRPSETSKTDPNLNVQCPNHPKLMINSFCLKDNCPTPFICAKCKLEHPKGHSSSFISLQNFFNDQFQTQYAKNFHSRFSVGNIEAARNEINETLNKMEDDVVRSIRELKKNANDYFTDLIESVDRLKKVFINYNELSNLSANKDDIEVEHIKQLIENYKILKQDIKIFDLSPDVLPANVQREADAVSNKFKYELLSKLNASLDLKPVDFFNLKVKTNYSIPASEGVLYEACAFIPKWNVLAVGFRKNQQGSLGLYNIKSHELVSSTENVHKRWINHVIWVEKWNCIVTCSNDTKIKVFGVKDEGKTLKNLTTFRGHTNLVRCIKYLEHHDLLASAGDDTDIKIWDLKKLRRYTTISTNGQTNMDGSIAYIPKDNLIGVGFRSGFIRFYNIYKRTLAFEFKTGFENFYTYGLQYLPKRKLILGRVKEHVIKVWKYDEDKKKVEQYKTITAKGSYPDCIVPNEDESQLLFTSRDQFLEMYDFNNDKSAQYNLQPHIKKTNALLFLDNLGKVSVCDYTSGKVCILH